MVADKYIAEVMAAYDVVAEIFDDAYRDEKETEDHAQWLIAVLRELNAKKILDAAAGTGEQSIRLWQSGHFNNIVANDSNSAMLKHCKDKLKTLAIGYSEPLDKSADLSQFGLTQLDWLLLDRVLPEEYFDAILCLGHCYYHLITTERLLNALKCWNSLLKPGGHLLIDMNAEQAQIAKQIRASEFKGSSWNWTAKELTGRSGKLYLKTAAKATIPLAGTPLGWYASGTWIISDLSSDRRIENNRCLSTGGAILDELVIEELAETTGFVQKQIPAGSPPLHTPTIDFLLQKVK